MVERLRLSFLAIPIISGPWHGTKCADQERAAYRCLAWGQTCALKAGPSSTDEHLLHTGLRHRH